MHLVIDGIYFVGNSVTIGTISITPTEYKYIVQEQYIGFKGMHKQYTNVFK